MSVPKVRIIKEKCDPVAAEDKSLPYTCFLVKYSNDNNETCYDLVVAAKQVDIFDHYWDKYREGFMFMKQSSGTVNPKLWDPNPKPAKKK